MSVNIIIEGGSGVANANSYGVTDVTSTLAAARDFAASRGVTLSSDDDVLSVALINATDYLESLSRFYVGKPTSTSQALSWPRQCVRYASLNDYFPSNQIPQALLNALYQLCIEQSNGVDLMPTLDRNKKGAFVLRQKLGELDTTYSEKIGTTIDPIMPKVNAFLSTIVWAGPGKGLKVVRS